MSGYPYKPPFECQFDPDRAQEYIIMQLLRSIHTCTLVRVTAVRPQDDRVGFVDVIPLILDVDTADTVIEQMPIFNVPFLRYQGGTSAVILDPVIDDIGLAIFADRDITSIKSTLQAGPAATARAYSSADGLYIGGVLNQSTTQFVRFQPESAGINITSPGAITINAGSSINIQAGTSVVMKAGTSMLLAAPNGLTINANVTLNGTLAGLSTGAGAYGFAGTISAPEVKVGGVNMSTHKHGGVQGGGSDTGGPHN